MTTTLAHTYRCNRFFYRDHGIPRELSPCPNGCLSFRVVRRFADLLLSRRADDLDRCTLQQYRRGFLLLPFRFLLLGQWPLLRRWSNKPSLMYRRYMGQ